MEKHRIMDVFCGTDVMMSFWRENLPLKITCRSENFYAAYVDVANFKMILNSKTYPC